MTQPDLLEQLEASGALKRGHFLYASGMHGDIYLEKFDLLRNPVATSKVCEHFAERFRDERIDVVVGPTTGGILLAFETARQLGVAAAYAERSSEGTSGREIRRGTTFQPGARVLVVDDILTTGGSVRETLAALQYHPVEVVAVGVLVDRSAGATTFGDVPLVPIASKKFDAWPAETCPLCADGVPLVKPGTTAQPAAS
ncbi:MAG TPA: orotate phosphoribosyltransferase [Thermomicrobiales bacterium]|nr:orotate phosphoribosyltransferase [Thermomicrobiales bacterium]